MNSIRQMILHLKLGRAVTFIKCFDKVVSLNLVLKTLICNKVLNLPDMVVKMKGYLSPKIINNIPFCIPFISALNKCFRSK